jgi:hypothetical protein
MFTVKQMVRVKDSPPDCDQIRLWEAKVVQLEFNTLSRKPNVYFDLPEGVTCSLDSGIVYVMNAAGKTVETFRLEGAEAF